MATDPNPALRAELQAASDALSPAIRGFQDLLQLSANIVPDDERAILQTGLDDRVRRKALIDAVIGDLDEALADLVALEADGYPVMEKEELPPNVAALVAQQKADIEAAFGELEAAPVATGGEISFPDPTPKP